MNTIATDTNTLNVRRLVDKDLSQPDFSMEQAFYSHPQIHDLDIKAVFKKQWIMVDHVSRIPERGQYFLFEIANESIIIVRENEDTVNAFYNVCRHRGSRVCLEKEGKRKLLMCPYHAWSYGLDGSLKAASTMPETFDKTQYNLHPCHVKVFEGLIFINLSDETPPDFDATYGDFRPFAQQQGLDRAKIAVKRNYPNGANWKLVVENFIECYHCAPAHSEYCSVHPADKRLAFGAGPGSGPADAVEKYQVKLDAWEAKTKAMGHLVGVVDGGEDSLGMHQAARFPINDRDWQSETLDGSLACKKLMGTFKECDGGQTALAFNPFSFVLACNDFAVLLRWTPRDALNTDVELTWLVDQDAEEGVDYDPDAVANVWDITIKQDKKITEDNQAGILSERYIPGPYSLQEARNISFKRWYLNQLSEVL